MPRPTKHPQPRVERYAPAAAAWNAGKPWSDWCVFSLLYQYEEGDNIQDIAISLQRNPDEVEAKIKELGLSKMTPNQLREAVERAKLGHAG
jgi:hypothetical protein